MSDPIDTLIRANPTPAVVHLPAVAAAAYNPSTTYGLPAEPEPEPTVDCLFIKVTEAELLSQYEATATFRLGDFPDIAESGAASVEIDGVSYVIHQIRKRYRRGAQNGWTVELRR